MKSMNDKIICDACIKSKITHKPLPKEPREQMQKLGEQVYSDVWGPARHLTINKKLYYISFINDYSRESVIYLMNTKDQAFDKYKLYAAMMYHQRDVYIKTLVTDRGGKYIRSVVNLISKPPICAHINFIFIVLKFPTHRQKYS